MKVQYTVVMTAALAREGGWDDKCTLEQVKKQALDHVAQWQVFIRETAKGDFLPVPAQVTLKKLELIEANEPGKGTG